MCNWSTEFCTFEWEFEKKVSFDYILALSSWSLYVPSFGYLLVVGRPVPAMGLASGKHKLHICPSAEDFWALHRKLGFRLKVFFFPFWGCRKETDLNLWTLHLFVPYSEGFHLLLSSQFAWGQESGKAVGCGPGEAQMLFSARRGATAAQVTGTFLHVVHFC